MTKIATFTGFMLQSFLVLINLIIFVFVFRVGRCGRFGRKGVAISLITKKDYPTIKSLEQYYSTQINEMPLDVANFF